MKPEIHLSTSTPLENLRHTTGRESCTWNHYGITYCEYHMKHATLTGPHSLSIQPKQPLFTLFAKDARYMEQVSVATSLKETKQRGSRMEGEEGSRRPGDLVENPLLAQLVMVKMEDIMDKLKLLQYESAFCKKLKFKLFSRYHGLTWFLVWSYPCSIFQALLCGVHKPWRTVFLLQQPSRVAS